MILNFDTIWAERSHAVQCKLTDGIFKMAADAIDIALTADSPPGFSLPRLKSALYRFHTEGEAAKDIHMLKKIVYCIAFLVLPVAGRLNAAQVVMPERESIQAIDERYVKAFNSGDADAAARDFSKDAVYVTDDGTTLHGVDEIKKALAEQFKDMEGATLKLNVYGIDVAPDKQHATERGVSIVAKDGIQEPSGYVAEFTREGDQWRLSRVVEQPQAPTAEHLQDLAWMIGDWVDPSADSTIRTKVEWSLDRGFITRKFAVAGAGTRELSGIEYIGWDPENKEIQSWYFDSEGGHGSGQWRKEGNGWIEESSGVMPDGGTASATQYTFTPIDENSFSWRVANRKVADEAQEDVPEIIIHRANKAQQDKAQKPQQTGAATGQL